MEHRGAGVRPLSYPALLLFGGLSTGVLVDMHVFQLSTLTWAICACVALTGALAASWYGARCFVSPTRVIVFSSAALVGVCVGGLRTAQFFALPSDHVAHLVRQDGGERVRLVGRAADTPSHRNDRLRFLLDVGEIEQESGGNRRSVRGRVQVTIRVPAGAPLIDAVRRGAHVDVRGTLSSPYPRRNPADFDFEGYLRLRGVFAVASVSGEADVVVTHSPPALIPRIAATVQRRIERALDRHIHSDQGRAVVSALLLGRKHEIDPERLEAFARTGLMHVLAVSGLHVLMVGMIVYGLLGPLLLRFRLSWRTVEVIRATITLSLLVVYAVVTGASASVTRAVVMTSVLIGGTVMQRSAPPLNSLGVAGCVLLFTRPTFLMDVGFQLSFSAVAGIVSLHAPLSRFERDRWDHDAWQARAWRSTAATIAATVGTAPVLLYHFGRISAAGLLLNPIAVPLTGLSLSAGLLTVLTGDFERLGSAFGHAADLLAQSLLATATVGDDYLGWASLEKRVTYLPFTTALALLVCAAAAWLRPRLRWRMMAGSLALFAFGTWGHVIADGGRRSLEMIAFDVGQGDAMLLVFPDGAKVLVDCGPRTPFSDAAERVLIPHLKRFGIRSLDAVILSHPHSDHIGGLPGVLKTVPVHRIIHNGEHYDSQLYREANRIADELDIPQQSVTAGDTLLFDRNVRVYVVAPEGDGRRTGNANDRSLALRVSYGEIDALLMGDVEAPAEGWLTFAAGTAIASEIIKVGHHGSSTSSTEPFVQAATHGIHSPHVLVSVGRQNRFGHPSSQVLDRWKETGADVYLTSETGAQWLRTDGTEVYVVPWRRRF